MLTVLNPGGGIDFDEAILDGVVREVFEETGYHVEPGALLAEHHFTARGRTFDEPITNGPVPMLFVGTGSIRSARMTELWLSRSSSSRGTSSACS